LTHPVERTCQQTTHRGFSKSVWATQRSPWGYTARTHGRRVSARRPRLIQPRHRVAAPRWQPFRSHLPEGALRDVGRWPTQFQLRGLRSRTLLQRPWYNNYDTGSSVRFDFSSYRLFVGNSTMVISNHVPEWIHLFSWLTRKIIGIPIVMRRPGDKPPYDGTVLTSRLTTGSALTQSRASRPQEQERDY